MAEKQIQVNLSASSGLLSAISHRDAAVWVQTCEGSIKDISSVVALLRLPWKLVLLETNDRQLVSALEQNQADVDVLARKRGLVQIVDHDPSRIELPQRCLPVYLLNGRPGAGPSSAFETQLRRLTMLETLRQSGVRELIVLSQGCSAVPHGFGNLWSSGFRAYLTFVSLAGSAESEIASWLDTAEGLQIVSFHPEGLEEYARSVVEGYCRSYPEARTIVRMRKKDGTAYHLDLTELDEPERPLLQSYSLLEERDLAPVHHTELTEEEFVAFFRDPTESWRPFSAELPWIRDPQCLENIIGVMQKLDSAGAEENCIAYISCEPGAGGSTLARVLALHCARNGYPVLVARNVPFTPDALPVVNYFKRVQAHSEEAVGPRSFESHGGGTRENIATAQDVVPPLYEAPWLVVFDSLHWENREHEILKFRNELAKAGRPACILVVAGSTPVDALFSSFFQPLCKLSHAIGRQQALELGRHLNRFLRHYGKQREDWQWDRFYEQHMVRHIEGIAAFWVTLSFWIQGQYDLSESIQEWLLRAFSSHANSAVVQDALLDIAALSSVRLPIPEALLPTASGEWPTGLLLSDSRSQLAALGLIRIDIDGSHYWALAHDILGRLLINAVFYEYSSREKFGFAEAADAEHLRLLVLARIAKRPLIGDTAFRTLGEEFAKSVLKIDPDHGHATFTHQWKLVLQTLDSMPPSLRNVSRVFLHHTAVTRRRIGKLSEDLYGVTDGDREQLLEKAIADIRYALEAIEYAPGQEPDINLYNSLANAYFDLADCERRRGARAERVSELLREANEATRRAYAENPNNSFVVETYVKNLLHAAQDGSPSSAEYCVEALGVLFSALSSNEGVYRGAALSSLADRALEILLRQYPQNSVSSSPHSALEVLVMAWRALASGQVSLGGIALSAEVPSDNLARALAILESPAGRGNMQVIRLRYDLACIASPRDYKGQLELVQQLESADYRMPPQLRLEYAILLFQVGRAAEGDSAFRSLRKLWKSSEYFVQVPERLKWLRMPDEPEIARVVNAIVSSDHESRTMALVREFGNARAPFRPEEHSMRHPKPGTAFRCYVSFGHNGPFLRPLTSRPPVELRGGHGG